MTSITGEQRWASRRRGGMTVLGKVAKVAVPKPLNLPSQKLENHGLDPNVEIVPKGTLSWGSRPSSSSSNPWGTSAPSPSTDGGSSSPRHLAGCPLSGGGTRPSTAGSEKAQDSYVNACGPNSRPSSASGALGSNHASLTSLRPHSADTRPGSSQLSRFAEHSPEGSGDRGAIVSSERMGVNEGFSLSSGDFPTLGSEKDESRMNSELLDASNGWPGSSSGGVKSMSDSMEIAHDDARDSEIKGHSWRKDHVPFVEDGSRPSMERWHGDPHLYPNPNIGPPHYDSWRGPPSANPPGGVWYRGPPGPPPYGGPVPPGGFHMEPFPYYRPQVPAPGLANSQSIPPGVGHHGHHPKNGDMYRPHLPESFMCPELPMRPGFYPAPVPYEGYYGPPMGFCNPNERDLPFMGMANGPIYSRPTNPNAPDLNSSHPRSCEGRGPDQVDPDYLHDPRANYKVLVKRNDGEFQNDKEKWGHRVITDGSNREKGILSKTPLLENAWGGDYKKHESLGYGKSAAKDEVPFRPLDNRFHSTNTANRNLPGSVINVERPDIGPATDDLAASRDHSLIRKIEGLNAKTRASGGNQDAFHREELTERVPVVNVWAHQSIDAADTGVVLERHNPTGVLVPVSRDADLIESEKSGEPIMAADPRRAIHGAQNRGNRHGKGNFDGQEASRWGRKSQSHSVQSAGSNLTTNDQVEDYNLAMPPTGVRKANVEMKVDGESAMSGLDPSDTQRTKMREIAKQRAIQLQKEEEERIREQKAKALAKLEELNRRSSTHVTEVPSQKEIVPTHSAGPLKPDDSRDQSEVEANLNTGPSLGFSGKIAQIDKKGASKVVKNAQQDSVSSQNQSPTANVNIEDGAGNRSAAQVYDVSEHKRAGHKSRQKAPPEKNIYQKSIMVGQIDILEDHKGENVNQEVTAGSKVDGGAATELPETPLVSDPSSHMKKRNSKSGKNKHNVEGSSSAISSTVFSQNNYDHGQAISARVEDHAADLHSKELSQPSGSHSPRSREDVHGRVNNAGKAQHSRKPRNSQGSRLSEKAQSNDAVVWAPVRSHNKVEVPEPVVSSAVGENMPHSSSKTKRAEMERYVPKPVAKELAQQGSIQQPPSLPVDHFATAQASQDSSAGIGGKEEASHKPFVEGRNRHSRGQGSWRQRVSAESYPAQPSDGATVGSNESMMVDPPNRPTELSMKGPEAGLSDGWSSVNDSSSKSSAAFTGPEDQFPSGRGRRQPFKGQKGNFQSFEPKDSNAGSTDSRFTSEINRIEKTESSKENRAVVDRSSSHWQPKSQVYRGGKSHIAENSKGSKSDIGSGSVMHPPSLYYQSEDKAMQDMGYQESKREKRGPHVKGRPHPPSQGLEAEVEPALSEAGDGHNEHRPSSGYRKNPNYRVHEPRGDWSTTAPERKQHYSSANQERLRQNSHYEYQAVGPYDSEPQIENQHGGPRFRGRGHSRRGRGNFYGRQSGNE